jgi:hypothetical protein
VLYDQWEKERDLDSRTLVESLMPILEGLDLAGDRLMKVLAPLGAILIHQGLESFCEEYGGH